MLSARSLLFVKRAAPAATPAPAAAAAASYSTVAAAIAPVNARQRSINKFIKLKTSQNKKRSGNFYGPRTRAKVNDTYIAQLLDAYAAKRTYRPAIKLFDKLQQEGMEPSIYNYRKLLYTVGYKGQQVAEAERMFEAHRRAAQQGSSSVLGNAGDLYCFNTMMHVYAKCVGGMEGYAKAKALFTEMQQASQEAAAASVRHFGAKIQAQPGAQLQPNSFSYFYLLKCFLNTAPKSSPLPDGSYEQEMQLSDDARPVVQGIVDQMLAQDRLRIMLANRHIKALLQRMGMYPSATAAAATAATGEQKLE